MALFSLENQLAVLLNGGRHPAWVAVATGTAWVRWQTAFRILSWFEVADFDLVFGLLVLSCISVFLLRFICFGCCSLGTHFLPFTDVLRKIFGSLTRKVGFAALNR